MFEENKELHTILKRFFGSIKEDSSAESLKRASGRALAALKSLEEKSKKQF